MKYVVCFVLLYGVARAQPGVTAPAILPSDGATGIPLNARIFVTNNYSSYTLSPFKVTKGGAPVSGSTQVNFPVALFTPDNLLDPNTTYKVEFDSILPFFFSFTTGTATDRTPLQLVSSNPSNGQDGVSPTGSMTLHFNKPLNPGTLQQGQFSIHDLTSGETTSDYSMRPQIQPDGSTLVFDLAASGTSGVPLGHAFQFLFLPSGITDWLGNPLSSIPAPITFTTFRTPEKAGPGLLGTVPADGEAAVAMNSSIVLVFERPLAPIAWDSAVTMDSGGPLKFKLDNTLAGGRALVIQPALLLPPNSQVSVKVSGLLDVYGASLPAPINIAFHTGATVETRQLFLTSLPSVPLAQNAAILATFNRPIDPLLLSLGGVKLYSAAHFDDFIQVPTQVSGDNQTVTLKPTSPLPAGNYSASVSVPFDRTAGKLQPFTMNFTLTGDIDSTPPQVLALTPPDGTPDAPTTSLVQVTFSEPVISSSGSAPFQLLKDGTSVAGTFTLTGSQGSFSPKIALDPSTIYQVSISGFTDLAGNPLASFSGSFTTAASDPSDHFQVTGVVPASKATVDPSVKIVLTFNRELDPVSLYQSNTRVMLSSNSATSYVPGQFEVHAAVLTFTPSFPLPAGTYNLNVIGLTDLAGNVMTQFASGFSVVGPPSDSTPPSVISVSPGDGQPVLFESPYVVFTFSKPIDPRTLQGTGIAAYGPNGNIAVKSTVLGDYTRVAVTFSANAGTLITLFVTPGVADFAGHPAAPFRSTVRMSDRPSTMGAFVVLQRPGFNSPNNLPPNTGLTLLFSAPVDRASVEQGLLVTANGAYISGRVDWSPDSMGLTFVSFSPYPYSATVTLALVSPAKDAAGNDLSYSSLAYGFALKIADAPPPPPRRSEFFKGHHRSLAVIASSLQSAPGPLPLDLVIELEFNQDVSASVGVATLIDDTTGPTRDQVTSCTATLIRPQVVRFTPRKLLLPNDLYTFQFDSGNGMKWSTFVSTGTVAKTSNSPYVVAAGPVGGAVALNAQITVAFSNGTTEFQMPGGLMLQTRNSTAPTRYTWSAGGRAVTLTPLALLHPDTDYTVSMTGFEDLAGHSIPDRTWTFHTSSAIDLEVPAILHTEPTGDAVSANPVISVTFSKPVAADWIDRFQVNDGGATGPDNTYGTAVAGRVRFSDDQRILFFTPDQPLAAGHYYLVNVPLADDFAGNIPGGAWYTVSTTTFRVGFSALGAPAIILATPDDGSASLPLNVQFQAQFDQPVLASSLDGVALFENGVPLPASARLEADGRTVTAVPERLPAAGSALKFVVIGVKNTKGVAMVGAHQASVTMGQAFDASPPTFRSSPGSGQTEVPVNATMRLRFNEPLNKLTVNGSNIALTRSPFNVVVDAGVSLQDSGRTVVVTPGIALMSDTSYSVLIKGISDLSGNLSFPASSPSYGVGFSTASGAATEPPVLLALDPPDGSQNVPSNPNIQIVYSQPVDLTLDDNSVQLFSGDALVPGTIGVTTNQISSSVAFTPLQRLADGVYRVQTSGIADVSGHPVDPVSSTFTVVAAGYTDAPRLMSSSPSAGAVGVPVSSAITLTFNKTVSSVSAFQLRVAWQGTQIPGSVVVQDSTVTFTPAVLLPGAANISVAGFMYDLWSQDTYVSFSFTTGAHSDTTPPKLVFSYPAQGSVVPAYGTILVLQFSKPVAASSGTAPIQVLAGSAPVTYNNGWTVGEDGRTYVNNLNLPADTDITVAVTSDLMDFAGNRIQPFSLQFRTASDAQSRGPQILSVSPAAGAVNVDATSLIVVKFSNAMMPGSVGPGLQVTDAGVPITGSTASDSSAQSFTFRPDVPYQPGSTVEIFAGPSIFDTTGAHIDAFYSHFGTLGPQGVTGQTVSFSASANAIDVRFSGRVPADLSPVYLRRGMTLVPAEVIAMGVDQIRVVPTRPLDRGELYDLVLDATQELPIRVENEVEDGRGEVEVVQAPGAIRMRFSGPVNPLTVLRGGVKLSAPDGAPVDFTTQTSMDGTVMLLMPALDKPVTVVIDGVESRAGRRLETQIRRP